MISLVSVSIASLAFLSSSVQALPYNPSDFKFYGHDDPMWSVSAPSVPSASQTVNATSVFPTLSLNRNIVASGYATPSGFATGSGFIRYPTASGYAWPSGTGSAFGYAASPTGTGYNATGNSKWQSWSQQHGSQASSSAASQAFPKPSANATTSSSTPTVSAESSALPTVLRGLNIGGWLVLEQWMTSDIFDNTDAIDQWTFDSTQGAESTLQSHWSSYFTESDVEKIASWGINAVRIPIGYWAYDNAGTPYISGADAYLEKAIGWCRSHGIKVLVDCHGSPGSQNGFDNSGRSGNVDWQSGDNMNRSISVLEKMATKYGAAEYSDVVFGIEMVNEPISWGNNNFETTKQWAQQAYSAIKAVATNPDLNVIMHDSFQGPSEWSDISSAINGDCALADSKFWIDTHLYQNQEASDSLLTQDQHVKKACNWSSSELLPSSSNLPVIAGEFSAATNICANPDGSTVAGSVCWISGCQCSANVDIEDWNEPLINATRKFLEAELDTFEDHARGYFMWNYKAPGAWGYDNAVQYGLIGKSVTDRMFPGQCDSS